MQRRKYFYSYITAISELEISRRTLQRWIDYTNIEPLEFEDHSKVFLTLPHMEKLREYKRVLETGDRDLLEKYKQAFDNNDDTRIISLRKLLIQLEKKGKAMRG